MGLFMQEYGAVLDAARQGRADDYFKEFYRQNVPNAGPEHVAPFLDYIARREQMYIHYGWEPALATTNAVMDGIDALSASLCRRMFSGRLN